MNENEYFEFDNRAYQDPTLSRDEQLGFIDTLRETMSNNLGQINRGTYALGSQLPNNLGGLGGAEATFEARYQRPQLEATAANLRATAQASALNTALSNLQAAWKKKYNDAVMAYQRRAATPSTTNNNNSTPEDGSSLFDTLTQGTTGVDFNGNDYNQALDEAMANATAARQQGGPNASNTEVYMAKINGQNVYITVYKNALGQIMGLSDGTANYDPSGAARYLQQLAQSGNLFDTAGKSLNYTQVTM